MGRWSMGVGFWIKYLITLPLLLIMYIPHWIIRPFSKERADQYSLYINRKTSFIDDWIS